MIINSVNILELAEKVSHEIDGVRISLAEDKNLVNLEEDCSCVVPAYVFRQKARKEYIYGLHHVLKIDGVIEDETAENEDRLPNCTTEKHYSSKTKCIFGWNRESRARRLATLQLA